MRHALATILSVVLLAGVPALAQDAPQQPAEAPAASWLPSLMTDTPEAGFNLALTMARKAVTSTQTDKTVLHAVRPNYSTDPQSLIEVSGVVAAYFATVAAANNYWRD